MFKPLVCLGLLPIPMLAQTPGDTLAMYFDMPGESLQLDSVYPPGCWQIGVPSKPVFAAAWSPGRALVTDTVLPHPTVGSCYAEFKLISTDWEHLGRTIAFMHRTDMGPSAMGRVEVFDPYELEWRPFGLSAAGDEWLQFEGGASYAEDWSPYWAGTDTAWKYVQLESPCLGLFWNPGERDLEWYESEMRVRFVFHAMDNPEGRDGWMVDNVRASVLFCAGSVAEQEALVRSVFPLPAGDHVTFELDVAHGLPVSIELYDMQGRLILKDRQRTGSGRVRLTVPEGTEHVLAYRVVIEGRSSTGLLPVVR